MDSVKEALDEEEKYLLKLLHKDTLTSGDIQMSFQTIRAAALAAHAPSEGEGLGAILATLRAMHEKGDAKVGTAWMIARLEEVAAPLPARVSGTPAEDVIEWLRTELGAIDTWYRGSPSYEHDAGWMKDRVFSLLDHAEKAFPARVSGNEVEAAIKPFDFVAQIGGARVATLLENETNIIEVIARQDDTYDLVIHAYDECRGLWDDMTAWNVKGDVLARLAALSSASSPGVGNMELTSLASLAVAQEPSRESQGGGEA